MVAVVAALVLGLVMLVAAGAKAVGGRAAQAALASYGFENPRAQRVVWPALVGVELVLGVGVAAGVSAAAYGAAALMAGACAVQLAAIMNGRAGAPCGCFGTRGRIGRPSAARAGVLAVSYAILPQLHRAHVTKDGWLAIGLAVTLLALVALAVVVLALAREVGVLRLAVGPQDALELAHEGPEVGAYSGLAEAFGDDLRRGGLGLAVFTSDGCGLCRALAPTVAAFGSDPRIALKTFDEVADSDAWAAADVPGSPFAVALGADGTVLAKGTFNTGAQLESVLATAERRQGLARA